MVYSGPDEQSAEKVEAGGDAEDIVAVETGDGDDDNDEFVEWNEGDGNVPLIDSAI